MSGTENTISELSGTSEQQNRLIERLSELLFNPSDSIYDGCNLVDISECGGAILIPKKTTPNKTFDLIIHISDNLNNSPSIVRAELRWIDEDYSENYKKIGVHFQNRPLSSILAIKNLISEARIKDKVDFECSLIY